MVSPPYPLHRRHSLHAISCQLSPVPGCTGIELLEADTFNLHCFQVHPAASCSCAAARLASSQQR